MENKMNQSINILIPLVEELLTRNEVNVKAHVAALQNDRLPAAWTIRESFIRKHRPVPMEEANSYIDCEGAMSEKSFQELKEAVQLGLQTVQPTVDGLVTLLFFINAIGFVYEEERNQLQYEVIDNLPLNVYLHVLHRLIVVLNQGYHFATDTSLGEEPFLMYEKLNHRLQYIDRLDSPVRLIVRLLRCRLAQLPLLDLVGRMSPEVKVSVFEFPFEYVINPAMFLDFLRDHPDEAPFWAMLLVRSECRMPSMFSKEVLDYLAAERWADIGRHLMLRIFGDKSRMPMDESLRCLLTESFGRYMTPFFFEEVPQNILITPAMDLNSELRAFASWLNRNSETFSTRKLNQATMTALHKVLQHQLERLADGAAFVSSKQNIYNAWFSDVYDVSSQVAITLLHASILRVPTEEWNKTQRAFAKVCYTMRIYYYGSYKPSEMAKQVCNHLLTLLLTCLSPDEDAVLPLERITSCVNVFGEQVLFHWVHLSEREDIIWDKAPVPRVWNSELGYILEKLSAVPLPYRQCFTGLFEKMVVYRTTPWPIEQV